MFIHVGNQGHSAPGVPIHPCMQIDNSPSFKFAEHLEMFDEDERTARNTVRKDFTRGHVTATMWGQLAELAPFMVRLR